VGPLRLSSRRTLALIQICASEADASSFVRSTVSLSRLPPASGRCRVAPTERAPCLLASWDNYSTHVRQRQVFLPAGSRLFIPRLKDGGFQAWISVNERVTVSTSYRYKYFFCTSKSSEIPFSASVTRLSIVERLKTLPSPVPCTSMRLCSEVITTLKSTSARESSS